MAVIRVYPQYGASALNAMNRTNAVSAQRYYTSQLQSQKQIGSLQLAYERKLAAERLDHAKEDGQHAVKIATLQARLQNPYGLNGVANPYVGMPVSGVPVGVGYGGAGLPLGGMGYGAPSLAIGGTSAIGNMGGVGLGALAGRGGQANITNQISTGGAAQSVTNSNVNNVRRSMQSPYGMMPHHGLISPYGGGGFLSGLLGALI